MSDEEHPSEKFAPVIPEVYVRPDPQDVDVPFGSVSTTPPQLPVSVFEAGALDTGDLVKWYDPKNLYALTLSFLRFSIRGQSKGASIDFSGQVTIDPSGKYFGIGAGLNGEISTRILLLDSASRPLPNYFIDKKYGFKYHTGSPFNFVRLRDRAELKTPAVAWVISANVDIKSAAFLRVQFFDSFRLHA